MAKYECYGGPCDGGTEEAFSDLRTGDIVNVRGLDHWYVYQFQVDGRLHYVGTKPTPNRLNPDLVDKLMEEDDG